MPGFCVPPASFWLRRCAQVVRRLPMARYWSMNWLYRRGWWPPVFVAALPGSGQGLRFECDLRNLLAREVFFTGQYEPQESILLRRLLGEGGTFVDVGAHWGYFSLRAAERVGPTGRVVAVEADPRIYATLARNLALNALPGAVAIHAAAAAEPGVLPLIGYDAGGENWGISRIAGATASGAVSHEVPARPLDGLLDELGVGAVDLIKIDIEGALALQGMGAGLGAHRYRRILIELHPAQLREHGTDARAVLGGLLGAGYRGWVVAHSAADTRRVAYARGIAAEELVRPLGDGALDEWPHLVFTAPDIPLFLPAGGP